MYECGHNANQVEKILDIINSEYLEPSDLSPFNNSNVKWTDFIKNNIKEGLGLVH